MRIPTPLLLALALAAGPACATEAPDDAGSHAARRAEFEQRFLDQVDADHDGMVSRAEYQAWVDRRFAKLDANGDGRVDADEIAASPQATVSLSSSTVPGAPLTPMTCAASSLTRSPPSTNHAPGTGANARTWRSTCSAARAQSMRVSALSILAA